MKSSRASRAINIEDLRKMAHERLPRVVFNYVDGGAEDELTLRENERAFHELIFRPRHAVSFPEYSLGTEVVGANLELPFLLAPVGYSRLMHPQGEIAAARAAGAAGTAYILSTISGHSLENVKAATKGPAWYQLYLLGGREAAEPALRRARTAGYSALVVTIDTAVAGMRERDFRNGMREIMGNNVFAKIPYLRQFLSHPRWLAGFLADGGTPRLPNVVLPGSGPAPMTDVNGALARSVVTWQDFRWIHEVWGGPILAKGILTGEDARCAIDQGVSGIVVSNHGGRQLDSVSATLTALPEVVKAVDGRCDVLLDGGVRRGSDIVKALCLGARAVLIGRAYAYGLGAAGEAGVGRAIEILKADLERTLRLLGCPSVRELNPSFVEYKLAGRRMDYGKFPA